MINLKEIDETISLWESFPNEPLVLDEEQVDWTEDYWTCEV